MTMGVCPNDYSITCGGGGSLGTQKSTYVIFSRPPACMSNATEEQKNKGLQHDPLAEGESCVVAK